MVRAFESGEVHLAGLDVLAGHLSESNVEAVLARAAGKSQRELQALVAELSPKPDVPVSIRRVAAASKQAAPLTHQVVDTESAAGGETQQPGLELSARRVHAGKSSELQPGNSAKSAAELAKPVKIRPPAPARYHVSFTASEQLKNHLDRAKELSGHGAHVDQLIEDAMALLVADCVSTATTIES